MSLVHPNRLVESTTERINENFILIEFHNDIREPPALFALHAVPVVGAVRGLTCVVDRCGGDACGSSSSLCG